MGLQCTYSYKAVRSPYVISLPWGFSFQTKSLGKPTAMLTIKRLIEIMRRKERKILEFQIVVFLEWARKHNRPSSEYRPYLFEFCDFTPKEDIWEVTDEDVDEYIYVNTDTIKTKYQEHVCRKALNGLRKYYSSRARNGVAKEHAGRPKNIGDRLLVHKYRKMRDEKGKPLSFRVISKIMDKSSALVHRWSKEPVDRWEE